MSLSTLRQDVCRANLALVEAGLVTLSFGNASGVDRDRGVIVIKPSGVPYAELTPEKMVVVSLAGEEVVDGGLRPSSDTPTHAVLYRRFPSIGGVVHTHSPFASGWAQAQRPIPALGTTHADHFAAAVPVTRSMTAGEIGEAYEHETGEVIVETLDSLGLDPLEMPAALVASHGPFTWGTDAADAVTNAIALEAVAALAHRTFALSPDAAPIADALLRRHFARKHGPGAYYGQVSPPDADDS
jgi:L-ribulose-5-phosphate 4-epimerase